MTTNLPHMIRLEQIAVNNDAPVFARAYIKQENVWKPIMMAGGRQVRWKASQVEANHDVEQLLKNYPDRQQSVQKWREGMQMAQDIARTLGMGPRNDP